jgi:hypothetical protein
VEYLIGEWLKVGIDEKITGSGYNENGHTFYVLSFPLAGKTIVYDLDTNMWHERAGWSGTDWTYWRGSGFHAHVFSKMHVTANIDSNAIWRQSLDIYQDGSNPIRRYRAAPYVANDQQWLFHHYVRLFLNGNTPVSMRYLYDDQTTWSNTRTVTPLSQEIKYRRLGRARDRLYEVWLNDSTSASTSIIEAYLHASPGVER